MIDAESATVFRATVRGRFADLSDRARQYLAGAQADHDLFKSGYTPEGTFTYDAKLDFFNLRYELRLSGDDRFTRAEAAALVEAETFLTTMQFGFRNLRVNVVDTSAIWAEAALKRG